MARYKPYNLKQDKMIPLSYGHQIVPGSFEYALNEIVAEHLSGASAYLAPRLTRPVCAPIRGRFNKPASGAIKPIV
jgi:hypothetical protein